MALALTIVAGGCERDPPAAPAPPAWELNETLTPGTAFNVVEVLTFEYPLDLGSTAAVYAVEVAKQVEVEIVQVDPSARPTRYRKRFIRYRQRTTVESNGAKEQDALVHPLEGETVSYRWSEGGWSASYPASIDPSDDRLPEQRASQTHPWLPPAPVRIGDQWTSSELPFALPSGIDVPHLELRLIEAREVESTFVAKVGVSAKSQQSTIELEGHLTLARNAGGIGLVSKVQLAGTLPHQLDGGGEVAGSWVLYRSAELKSAD